MKNIKKLTVVVCFISITASMHSQTYTYTLFDYPGETLTYATDVDDGKIIGFYLDTPSYTNVGFIKDGENFSTFNYPGQPHTRPQGIDGDNIVGYYMGWDAVSHGFYFDGSSFTTLDYSGGRTEIYGIYGNYIVGYYKDGSNHYHGLLYQISSSTWTVIDRPGSLNTKFTGVHGNNIVGNSGNDYSNTHTGFIYNISSDSWTSVDYLEDHPGTVSYEFTEVEGVDATHVVVYYEDFGSGHHNFTYEMATGTWTNIDNPDTPSGRQTTKGIDGLSSIVGDIEFAGPGNRGFIRTPESSGSEEWTIVLRDSYGDGWNGGSIDVLVNGTVVLDNLTIASGGGPQSHTFGVSCDDVISTVYTAGSWGEENEYQILDQDNEVVAESGQSGDVPENISTTYTCGGGGGGGNTFTLTLVDSYDNGWENAYVNVVVNGTPVLSNITLTSGASPASHTFDVPCSGLVEIAYYQGYCCNDEHSYSVTAPNGATVINEGPNPWSSSYTYYCGNPGTVTTQAVTSISFTTATGNGNITSLGSANPTAHGMCWNTTGSPTLSDGHTDEGAASATGAFTSAMSGLSSGATYYVRAYIVDEGGTTYGNEVSFTTSFVSLFNGSGTEGDPYQINNLTDLENLSLNSNYWDKYFIQTADINASATSTWNSGQGFSPIGNTTTTFSGDYNGQNYTISNLYINRSVTARIGLFGYLNTAVVENLKLTNATVSGGQIRGILVGHNYDSDITNCHVSGSLTGNGDNAGGITGAASYAEIKYCSSSASVSSTGTNTGGFIGYSYGYSYIHDCYATGPVTRSSGSGTYYGGFAGRNDATIRYCYSTGSIFYTGTSAPTDKGFVGINSGGTYTANYFDSEVSNQSTGTGATAKTTAEMKNPGTYTGWDFNTIWSISPVYNSGYPNLDDQSFTYIWAGTLNTDWNTSGNWNGGGTIPSMWNDVTVPNVSNDPVVESVVGASCNNLTLNTGATLTINSGGSLITNGTITNNGTINVERTISNGQWHLVSSPVSNATANTFLGKYLQSWSEPSHEWAEISEPATDLDAATGYLLWGTGSGSSTYTFTGTPLTGNQSKALTFTEYSADPQASEGANLVGNPYPSSIDWDLLRSTYGAVYYLDNGNYVSWNNGGSGSRYVPPLQGFFVMTNSNTTLNLTNTHRTHTGASSFYKQVGATEMVVLETNSPDGYTDKLYIRFEQEAQPYFELPRDAWKLPSFVEGVSQLWSVDPDGGRLSIDVRPATESIPVGFSNTANGTFSIGVAQWGNQPVLYLEDTQTGQVHNLRQGAYYFSHTATDNPNRFKLLFGAIGTPETATSPIRQWISGHTLYISAPGLAGQQAQVKVLGISGQKLQRQQVTLGDIIAVELQSNPGVVVVETISLDGSAVHTTKGVVIK